MTGTHYRWIRDIAFTVVAVFFAAFQAVAQEPIKIGVVLPLGGQYGDYNKRYLIAPTELAVKEINAKGGLLGRQVRLIIEDSRNDPASAVAALRKLSDVDKVIAVFTGFTPLTLPQLPVAEEKRIIVLAPSTEHPDLTKSPWAVRMTPTADKAGIRLAQVAFGAGVKTVVLLSEDNESVRLSERAFGAEFERLGGKILGAETFKSQDSDVRGQLTKLRSLRADAMFVQASNGRPMSVALKQLGEVGARPKQLFANHLIEDDEVKAVASAIAEGIIYTTLSVDPAFAQRWKSTMGYDVNANVGKHYDATVLLFEAIRRAGSDDAGKIRDEIYKFGEFKGVLGTFRFQGSGEPAVFPSVKTVKGGAYVDYVK